MTNKTEHIVLRVTPELKQRLDDYVATVPGERSDVLREAILMYLNVKDVDRQYRQALRPTLTSDS